MNSATKSTEYHLSGSERALHDARFFENGQKIDHIAQRAYKKSIYSQERYKNLLRCPEVVFKNYGSK